jgi:cytochrome b561
MADAEATAAIAPRGAASYDRVAQTMHWLVATLALAVVWLGWAIAGAPRNTPQRDFFVLVHELVGLTILAAMVFRAWWRWRHPPPPLLPASLPARNRSRRTYPFCSVSTPDPNALAGYSSAAVAGYAVSYFGVFSIRRYCRGITGGQRWRSRSLWSGNPRYISSWRFTSRERCSTALSATTESSSACCQCAASAETVIAVARRITEILN